MSRVFHRFPGNPLPTAVEGDGPYIIDRDGRRYLDASGGAAVSCLGHSHSAVIEAIKTQLNGIPFAHTSFFTSEPAEDLASFLVDRSPGLDWVYFVSGGSEAIEAALKLARQYFLELGEDQRRHFIARRQSYHGNTLGALAVGGNQWRRRPFESVLIQTHHISPCYRYRDQTVDETVEQYGLRVANELEQKIEELGADTVLAFIAEPVVGATAGAVPPVAGYFRRIKEICDQYNILLILDEVMCGMGRTGTLFAYEQEGVKPDMVVTAKGLGAGYQPIGALMVADKIYRTIVNGSGFFQHGHTYMGHPTACAAGLAVQKTIESENLLDNVNRQGEALFEHLSECFGKHKHIGDIRGRGLFVGMEIVEDRASKKPMPVDSRVHVKVKQEAMRQGLMCYPMAGTIDGQSGHHVLLAPPYIIDENHVLEIVDKLSQTFRAVL